MRSQKLLMPPVTVPFKWLVAVMVLAGSSMAGVVTVGIWVGSQSTTVSAQGREIDKLRDADKDLIPKVSRIEGILEHAFPREAKLVPKEAE